MTRTLSCIKPTGDVQLGNLLGAMRNWVSDQHDGSFHGIVDLHALTIQNDPAELRAATVRLAGVMLAAGLDPDIATLFVQSHISEHSELSWIMECTTGFGELKRMTQFKDKSEGAESVSAGLFTYPALMAADILLYDADTVPVGDDQRQHIELTRDLAIRFNSRYGDTFTVPKAVVPKAGARVMDLAHPTNKMSKSSVSPQGTIGVLEDLGSVTKKFKRAVTDSENEVRYDVVDKPGVSNLLDILAACTGTDVETAAAGYTQYGPLKADTAEAVVETLRPIQERYATLMADEAQLHSILADGAAKAREIAAATLARAQDAIGLLPAAR